MRIDSNKLAQKSAAIALTIWLSALTVAQTNRASRPLPPPARWLGLIGEYGPDTNILIVLEKDERLHALFKRAELAPLQEASHNIFAFESGPRSGTRMVFTRDARGRATQVSLGELVLKRRQIGPEEGAPQLHVNPVRPVRELLTEALAARPPKETGEFRQPDLVELVKLDPTIKLDIRYATTNNFLGTVFYSEARAFMQRPAAEAVVRVNHKLSAQGYGLLVHDAYRPWYVTKVFWEATPPDKHVFVADPSKGSRHNRGCAVDLTLYDLKTGRPIEMVSTYDETTDRAYPDYPGGTSRQRWHRELLRKAMESEGFTVYEAEWWHFDYKDWQKYPITNLRFEKIGSQILNPAARQSNLLALVEAERAFARAAATKGTRDAFLEFLADDGIIFQPGPVNGKQFWQPRAARKGLLSWQPIFADVSLAGDLGFTTGPYEFRPNGPDDKPVAFGQYFTIWKKQSDGAWRVALDRGTSNSQPTGATASLQFPKDEKAASRHIDIEPATGRALLLRLENEFSNLSSANGIEAAFRFRLADDARLFRDNSFPAIGKQAALAAVNSSKGILTWQPIAADISRSSDLGYTYGKYQLRNSDAKGKSENGNYVRVWKRERNGQWRVVIDVMNATPPA